MSTSVNVSKTEERDGSGSFKRAMLRSRILLVAAILASSSCSYTEDPPVLGNTTLSIIFWAPPIGSLDAYRFKHIRPTPRFPDQDAVRVPAMDSSPHRDPNLDPSCTAAYLVQYEGLILDVEYEFDIDSYNLTTGVANGWFQNHKFTYSGSPQMYLGR